MGILSSLKDLFKQKESIEPVLEEAVAPQEFTHQDPEELLCQLAGLLTEHDGTVLAHLEAILPDSLAYLEELGYVGLEDETRSDLLWLALANILEANDYLLIRDWKDELEDFTYFYDQLKPVQATGLDVASLGLELDDDQDLSVWLDQLSNCLLEKGYCLGTMSIDSDSYHVLVSPKALISQVDALAISLGQEIDFYG